MEDEKTEGVELLPEVSLVVRGGGGAWSLVTWSPDTWPGEGSVDTDTGGEGVGPRLIKPENIITLKHEKCILL